MFDDQTLQAISCKISNMMFDILQKILRSHCFLMSQKFKMQGYQRYRFKWIKTMLTDKGSLETTFGALLYYLK